MTTLNIRQFPDDLKRAIKVRAAQQGFTLQDWVIKILRDRIGEDKGIKHYIKPVQAHAEGCTCLMCKGQL